MHIMNGWRSRLITNETVTWLAPLCAAVLVVESLVLLATCF
jgi:hypothetical protein